MTNHLAFLARRDYFMSMILARKCRYVHDKQLYLFLEINLV